jgi:uncharacterized MAPEG superfamily protein
MDYLSIALLGNAALFVVLLIGQVVYRTKIHGAEYALGNLDQAKIEMCESRLLRVKNNQQESLILVISVIILTQIASKIPTDNLYLISIAHLISRAIYISFALRGVAFARSLTWIVGFVLLSLLLIL